MQINGEPIGAKLLFSEKPIRIGHPVGINFPRVYSGAKYFPACKVIPKHCFMYGGNTEKSRRK